MKLFNLSSILLTSVLLLASCGSAPQEQAQQESKYPVMKLDTSTAVISTQFAAELSSDQVIEIRPRVTGYLEKAIASEGDVIRKGDVMFLINKDDLTENYNVAKAQVESYSNQVDNAQLEVTKLTPLVQKGIISEYELQNAQSNLASAKAQYDAAVSTARNAEISLGYATITAPISGMVDEVSVDEGELISASNSVAMTKISSLGTISANFTASESFLVELIAKGKETNKSAKELISMIPSVQLVLSNGELYHEHGVAELASGLIDPITGTMKLKATFKNEDNTLRNGSTGKVVISLNYPGTITVPQSATYEVQDKIMLYVVNDQGVVSSKVIQAFGVTGSNYVVKSGLERGETIVVEGLDFLKNGDKIITTTK